VLEGDNVTIQVGRQDAPLPTEQDLKRDAPPSWFKIYPSASTAGTVVPGSGTSKTDQEKTKSLSDFVAPIEHTIQAWTNWRVVSVLPVLDIFFGGRTWISRGKRQYEMVNVGQFDVSSKQLANATTDELNSPTKNPSMGAPISFGETTSGQVYHPSSANDETVDVYNSDSTSKEKQSLITFGGITTPLSLDIANDLLVATSGQDGSMENALRVLADPTQSSKKLFGAIGEKSGTFNVLGTPYSLYDWEIGFFAPMLLAEKFGAVQQFDLALKALELVFNPKAKNEAGGSWKFTPFRDVGDSTSIVPQLETELKNETVRPRFDADVFSAHAIARQKITSYMIWTVCVYVQTIVEYGDYYFRQDTLETLPEALQLVSLSK